MGSEKLSFVFLVTFAVHIDAVTPQTLHRMRWSYMISSELVLSSTIATSKTGLESGRNENAPSQQKKNILQYEVVICYRQSRFFISQV